MIVWTLNEVFKRNDDENRWVNIDAIDEYLKGV